MVISYWIKEPVLIPRACGNTVIATVQNMSATRQATLEVFMYFSFSLSLTGYGIAYLHVQ